jgi:hypothetical protein
VLDTVLSKLSSPRTARLRQLIQAIADFYADPGNRRGLLGTALLLCYGGGIVMFGVHYTLRRECGPPINAGWHWLLDSTIGFVALTPLLVVLLPVVTAMVNRWTGTEGARPRLAPYSVVVGVIFALATVPGPWAHDRLAGRGRPLARLATSFFGEDAAALAHNARGLEHSMVSEGLLQLGVGLPVYIALSALALALARVTIDGLTARVRLAVSTRA